MAVNAASVISTTINTFRPDIYTAITTMEDVCYTTPDVSSGILAADAVTFFMSEFTLLSNALVAWMTSNRQSSLSDFIPTIYSYLVMIQVQGVSNASEASVDARNIFTCNGYLPYILTQPTSYYNHITLVQTPSPDTPTSPVFDQDIITINGGVAAEANTMSSVSTTCRGIVSGQINKSLFQDVPVTGTTSKSIMATTVFTTHNYKEVYVGLNVGTLTLPPGV